MGDHPHTESHWCGAGPRIEIRNAPFPVTILSFPSDEVPGTWLVKVSLEVCDRDTGERDWVGTDARLAYVDGQRPSDAAIVAAARECLHDMLRHEADEWLHVDGVRAFDPHAKGGA